MNGGARRPQAPEQVAPQRSWWRRPSAALVIPFLLLACCAAWAQRVLEEPDVPKSGCALYYTHEHSNLGRSYQLTCAAPIPDSIVVYPGRTQ